MHEDLNDAKNAGANVVRLDIAWATLDSNRPGQLTAWYSQKLSEFMAYANQLHLKVIGILFTTPCWASSAPDSLKQGCHGDWWDRGVGWYPPSNDQDFATFVRYITSTYGSDLAAAEIWNEPDGTAYWVSSNPASDYAQLLKAAYPAAKAGDSSVPVLAGAMAGTDLPFLQELYRDGIQGYYDGISVHSYCGSSPPDATASGDVRFEFEAGLEAIHALQLQHGDNTPIWVTEFGWDTLDTSPQDQATYIQQGYQILAGMPYVEAGVVYELHDDIGGSATDPGAHYGLLNQDYTPKPAYAAFTSVMTAPAAPVLTQPASGGVVNAPEPTFSFTATADSTIAVYIDGALAGTATADGAGNATLNASQPLTDGQHSVYAIDTDAYGNVGPASGSIKFTVEPAPPVVVTPQSGATTDPQPSFSFTAAASSTVAVYIDGTLAGTTTADGAGTATLTVQRVLTDGQHSVYATDTDSYAYVSPASASSTFSVVPPSPVIMTPRSGATSSTSLTVQVGGAPGDVATVCITGLKCSTATVNGQGAAAVPVTNIPPGWHSLHAFQSNGQGGPSLWSSTVAWMVSSSAGSSTAARATVASVVAPGRLELRLSKLRLKVVQVTCSVSRGTIERCQIAVYAHGRKVGSGKTEFRRSGRRSGTVRVRLNSLGRRYQRTSKGRLTLTFRASATQSKGHTLKTVQRARLAT